MVSLTNFSIDCSRKNKIYILNQLSPILVKRNKVSNITIRTLYDFLYKTGKEKIPLELLLVLIFDAQRIYYNNKDVFNKGTSIFKANLMKSALTLKVSMLVDKINLSFYRDDIPTKEEFENPFSNFFLNTTFSLPFLTDYFGYSNWYRSFTFAENKSDKDSLATFDVYKF